MKIIYSKIHNLSEQKLKTHKKLYVYIFLFISMPIRIVRYTSNVHRRIGFLTAWAYRLEFERIFAYNFIALSQTQKTNNSLE